MVQVPGDVPKRLDALLAPLKDPAMGRYAALALGLTALLSVSRPLFPAYFSVSLGVPDAMNVIILAAPFVAAALFGRAIGHLADRRGFHLLITVGMVIAGVSALATAVLSRFVNVAVVGALGLGALICSGLGIAVVEIALGRERFARTKPGFESEFLGLGNAVIGVGAAVGSLVGGALPDLCLRLVGAQDVYRGLFVAHSTLLFLVAGVFLLIQCHRSQKAEGAGQP
jgi:MFS family permease